MPAMPSNRNAAASRKPGGATRKCIAARPARRCTCPIPTRRAVSTWPAKGRNRSSGSRCHPRKRRNSLQSRVVRLQQGRLGQRDTFPARIDDHNYDWNTSHPKSLRPAGRVLLNDETLRDGLQSPSVRDPLIQDKIAILHLMESLGINSLNLGLPGAGPRAVEHVTALAREIVSHRMKIRANCPAGTLDNDFRPIA